MMIMRIVTRNFRNTRKRGVGFSSSVCTIAPSISSISVFSDKSRTLKANINQRHFSNLNSLVSNPVTPAVIQGSWGPEKFKDVPFVKEELRSVIDEVPDVKYYYIGDADPEPYPYRDIPIDQRIDYEVNYCKSSKINCTVNCEINCRKIAQKLLFPRNVN